MAAFPIAALGSAIVEIILAFAKAFGVGEGDACAWICENHPDLATSVERTKAARAAARKRTRASEAPDTEPGDPPEGAYGEIGE